MGTFSDAYGFLDKVLPLKTLTQLEQERGGIVRKRKHTRKNPLQIDHGKDYLGKPLSERELAIVKMIGDIMTDAEIADKLSLSVKTINKHATHIYYKLGIHKRGELIQYALAKGLVQNKFLPT